MGSFDDLKKDLGNRAKEAAQDAWKGTREAAKEAAKDAWDAAKAIASEVAKDVWEGTKSDSRRMKERDAAPIPKGVQAILDATPPSETPVIPCRQNTLIFKSEFRSLNKDDSDRGWVPGSIAVEPSD